MFPNMVAPHQGMGKCHRAWCCGVDVAPANGARKLTHSSYHDPVTGAAPVARKLGRALPLRQMIRDQRIRVAVPEAVLRFEQRDQLHVLEIAGALQHAEPVGHWMAVLLLNGREVGRWALDLFGTCHRWPPESLDEAISIPSRARRHSNPPLFEEPSG